MNPVSKDISDFLRNERLFERVYISREPTTPDNCITIYDTGFGEQNPKFALDENTFQVRSRNNEYINGYVNLESIKFLLDGRRDSIINGVTYIGFWCSSNIVSLGYDTEDRALLTLNFRTIRQTPLGEEGQRTFIGG